jgi:hypothetical protein
LITSRGSETAGAAALLDVLPVSAANDHGVVARVAIKLPAKAAKAATPIPKKRPATRRFIS